MGINNKATVINRVIIKLKAFSELFSIALELIYRQILEK